MKIAFINTYGNGSTGKIVDTLKNKLEEDNIECVSYFSREYCATPSTSKRFFSKIGFYYDALMTRVFDNHGLNSKRNTKNIIKDLKMFNPDIIHIHNLHGYWINYELLFKYIKKENKKVVFTLHDCWSFTGHCTHFDYIKCERWKNECYLCPQKKEYPKSLVFDGSRRNYRRKKGAITSLNPNSMIVVTPSEWLQGKVKESYLKKYECVVINNGINTSIFKPTPSNLREKYEIGNKIIVLAVASYWDEKKGLDFVIECASLKSDWIFVYIGKEKSKINCDLKNLIHIERTESTEELAKWYSVSDVYFNPTLEDTYPTTNLEAVACGTPVVTFNTGGSPEIINKTRYGKICLEKNAQSAVAAIYDVINSKIKVGNSYGSIVDSNTNFYSNYLVLYKKILMER
ncbi:MAG: glycosyltransferase [Clostridia bacterium]|nr:glycosyltransferase [Clostridia bacterium]